MPRATKKLRIEDPPILGYDLHKWTLPDGFAALLQHMAHAGLQLIAKWCDLNTLTFAADEHMLLDDGSLVQAVSFALITIKPPAPAGFMIGMIRDAEMDAFDAFSLPILLKMNTKTNLNAESVHANHGVASIQRELSILRIKTRAAAQQARAEKPATPSPRRQNKKS